MPHLHPRFAALVASAFLSLVANPSSSHAQGSVEVSAAGEALSASGPTATSLSVSNLGYTSSTTRLVSTTTGARTGGFLDGIVSGSAKTISGFTVSGITDNAMLTFTWKLSGTRNAAADKHSFQNSVEFGFSDNVAYYWVNWAIGYVDGPAFMGDFAGNASASPGISQAGNPDSFTLGFPSPWDGLGTINATITRPMSTAVSGTFYQLSSIGLAGDVSASTSIELLMITVPDASFLTGPAFFTLDSGLQVPITAVPEPSAAALLFGALALAGVTCRRRR